MAMIAAANEQRQRMQWAAHFEAEYNKCKASRRQFERQWYLNLAFMSGKQYVSPVEIAGMGFKLTSPRAPAYRVRTVVNKVRIAIRKENAKLTSSKPIPTVVPATNENEDQSAAVVGEGLLKTEFSNTDFNAKYREWIWWGTVCGNSFLKQVWNAGAKDYESMSLPEPPDMPGAEPGTKVPMEFIESQPQLAGLAEMLKTPQPAKGKVERSVVTPFHMFVPNILSASLEGQPYIIQATTENPEKVKAAFGLPTVSCDARNQNSVLDAASIITKGGEQHLDAVLVKEVWIKPYGHADFPEGGMLTIVNGQVVQYATKWPLPYPEYPFYKFDAMATGGFYADSVIVDLIPVQKEYNRTRSQMTEIKNTVGKPKLVYQRGSVDPRKISSEPGASIEYKAGYEKPQIVPGVDVPATFYNELEILRGDFDDIASQHEISRGGTPGDVSSGTAITFLQEQDDGALSNSVSAIEHGMEFLGRHYLSLVGKYWGDDRVVKINGKNNAYESMHWRSNILRGNTDVRIQSGSALPNSKAAKQALITEWVTNGFIPPEVGMEALEFGFFEKALDDVMIDKRQATRENLKLADTSATGMYEMLMNPAPGPNGEPGQEIPNPEDPEGGTVRLNGDGTPFQPQPPVPVNSWDNHEAHIEYHNQFRKTQEFELLPEANKMAFELHVQAHQMAMQANMVNVEGQITAQNQPSQAEIDAEAEANAQLNADQETTTETSTYEGGSGGGSSEES